MQQAIVFGPVPSRRLGSSLGVNNIPAKICSYACVYCQIGRTLKLQVRRQRFYEPESIIAAVERRVRELRQEHQSLDYVTFVPDGEPTLDSELGKEIDGVRDLEVKIAVITNGSLLWDPDVRAALSHADWVSVKIDSVNEHTWRRVDRPHGRLRLAEVLDGLDKFAGEFRGTLVTETMLVRGLNDQKEQLKNVAAFLTRLQPEIAYLAVPTRPPAESWVEPPSEEQVNAAYQIFAEAGLRTELLVGFEGDAFASTGDARADLLSITAVHPMRRDQVEQLLQRSGAGWNVVEDLKSEGLLREVTFGNETFLVRRFRGK